MSENLEDYIIHEWTDSKGVIHRDFEVESAVAWLLMRNYLILNQYWWKKDWSDDAKNAWCIGVICNDIFGWACADAEEIFYDEIESLYNHIKQDPTHGAEVWCIKKRGLMPISPVYWAIKHAGYWNLDIMGLTPND